MRLEVAFTPALLTHAERKVCVVIDVLRATTSAATMFRRGLEALAVAETVDEARRIAATREGYLLCGEEHSLPPEGFDHGNSPSEFDALDLTGKRAVLSTSNGTRALVRAAQSPAVFTGALVNLRAASHAALRVASELDLDIVLICAGRNGSRYFSLEDTFCAGAIVEEMMGFESERPKLWNDAVAAQRLYRSYRGSAMKAFREADHGASLVDLGLGRDLEFCARRNVVDIAPRLEREADGRLVLRVSG